MLKTELSHALVMQFEFSIPARMRTLAERIHNLARVDFIEAQEEQLSPRVADDVADYYMLFDWMRERDYTVTTLRPEIFG